MTRTIRSWACLHIGMRKTVAVQSLGRAGRALDCAEVKATCRKWLQAIYVGVGRPSPLAACNLFQALFEYAVRCRARRSPATGQVPIVKQPLFV